MYVELLTLLRCVHDIFGNQDVADLPHFRKKSNIYLVPKGPTITWNYSTYMEMGPTF